MNDEHQKTNREKRLTPVTKKKFWCSKCDRNLVHVGEKCSVCGFRNGKLPLKKETSA